MPDGVFKDMPSDMGGNIIQAQIGLRDGGGVRQDKWHSEIICLGENGRMGERVWESHK